MSAHRQETRSAATPAAPAAPAAGAQAPTFPAAELDRRFYSFVIDRAIAWTLVGLAVLAAWRLLIADGGVPAGVAVIVASVVLVSLALAALQGLRGFTPGKALLGLRVVHVGSGTPIGIVASMIRSLILGLATLPTFGLGLATLAWTAVMDRDRQRRGWHDHMTESIVVDVRPVPTVQVEADPGPRQIVNLTAMRLVPAPQAARPATSSPPPRSERPATRPGAHAASRVAPGSPAPAPATPTPGASALRAPLGPSRSGEGVVATARWRVTFDTGESFLVDGPALVGRRPEPRPDEPVRHLVALPSQDMSLSKTHAEFQVAPDGALVVMDRGSTNGSVVVRQGAARDLTAGKPTTLLADDIVRFGDRTMSVTREP